MANMISKSATPTMPSQSMSPKGPLLPPHGEEYEKIEYADRVVTREVAGAWERGRHGLHLPALPALKMAWFSRFVRARLKISTSSMKPSR